MNLTKELEKNQSAVFKKLLGASSVNWFNVSEKRIGFTYDNINALTVSRENMVINIEKCEHSPALEEKFRNAIESSFTLTLTKELMLNDKGKIIRKFEVNRRAVWVANSFVDKYNGCYFEFSENENIVMAIDEAGELLAATVPIEAELKEKGNV